MLMKKSLTLIFFVLSTSLNAAIEILDRIAVIVDDGVITHFNEEPGRNDFSADDDPYEVSDPDTMLKQLGAKTFMQDIANNN